MLRFSAGEALAKASKPSIGRRMSMLDVGAKTEECFIRKRDGSAIS